MRASVAALLTCALAAGCGDDTGILIAVKADAETAEVPVEEVEIIVGVREGDSGPWVKDVSQPELIADVTGRDLSRKPYKALLRDGRPGDGPSTVMVAAIGRAGGDDVAFAALDAPQTFMPGKVARHELLLTGATAGDDYEISPTGCLLWGEQRISHPDDLDCDGERPPADCDDENEDVNTSAEEVCGNGIDDNCNGDTDEGCEIECEEAEDCEEQMGPPPCGEYQCNAGQCDVICDDCTDGDLDGFGEGDGCAGPDCDDADDDLGANGTRSCYDGPEGTEDVGACRGGTQTCIDGVLGACAGQIVPGGEACNTEDDDCDGTADEALGTITCGVGACAVTTDACTSGGQVSTCMPDSVLNSDDDTCDGVDDDCDGAIDEDCIECTRVAPSGDDDQAEIDENDTPFATIQAAIKWSAAAPDRPKIVCVASGESCNEIGFYQEPVAMADGVHVYGRYRSSDFTRCDEQTTTVILPGTAGGVSFPSSVQSETVLDGFEIRRAAATMLASGVTIDGARGAVVSNVDIIDTRQATRTYGVRLLDGAEALITGSTIHSGHGSEESAGVLSVGSTPTIRDNCAAFDDAGRCEVCSSQDQPEGIGGRGAGGGDAYGVLLVDSPGAAVERSGVCTNAGAAGAAIRIEGAADGTLLRANFLAGFEGTTESDGVQLEACSGTSPWITFNRVRGSGASASDPVGIRSVGDCHPVIQRNSRITSSSEGGLRTTGVLCAADSGIASRCTLLDNGEIRGGQFGTATSSAGVRCEDGSCLRIEGNVISSNSGVDTVGLHLIRSGPIVGDNRIVGGCPTGSAAGVLAEDAYARLENNRILAGGCTGTQYVGLAAVIEGSGNELDVHSNVISGGNAETDGGACSSSGVELSAPSASSVSTAGGLYRNNIFLPGACTGGSNFVESSDAVRPRRLENNDFAPSAEGAPLYVDDGQTALDSAADINDMIAGAADNIDAPPRFSDSNFHLQTDSLCRDAGTPKGAPAVDMDGDPRDDMPDIGADEL